MKNKRKKINWRLHIEQWERSGKSKYAYCKEQELNAQSFMNNFKKIGSSKQSGFTELKVLSNIQSGIEFHYPDGSRFIFPVGCDASLIRKLIR